MTAASRQEVFHLPGTLPTGVSPVATKLLAVSALAALAGLLTPVPAGAPAMAIVVATLGFVFFFAGGRGLPSIVWGPVLGAAAIKSRAR